MKDTIDDFLPAAFVVGIITCWNLGREGRQAVGLEQAGSIKVNQGYKEVRISLNRIHKKMLNAENTENAENAENVAKSGFALPGTKTRGTHYKAG